jgi:hypothetical protein
MPQMLPEAKLNELKLFLGWQLMPKRLLTLVALSIDCSLRFVLSQPPAQSTASSRIHTLQSQRIPILASRLTLSHLRASKQTHHWGL